MKYLSSNRLLYSLFLPAEGADLKPQINAECSLCEYLRFEFALICG